MSTGNSFAISIDVNPVVLSYDNLFPSILFVCPTLPW